MSRRQRVIQVDEPAPVAPDAPWRAEKTVSGGRETRWRDGEELHTKREIFRTRDGGTGDVTIHQVTETVESALVPYDVLLAGCSVEQDDGYCETPWDSCDGYEHEIEDLERWCEDRVPSGTVYDPESGNYVDFYKHMKDCCPATVWTDRDWKIITVTYDFNYNYEFHRQHGASKQVARELVAFEKVRTASLLRDWYTDGWCWYGAKCEWNDYEDSVWGIDDEEYAAYVARTDILSQVIYQVEQDGYIVIGQPTPEERHGPNGRWTLDGFRRHLKRNLNLQNPYYEEPKDW